MFGGQLLSHLGDDGFHPLHIALGQGTKRAVHHHFVHEGFAGRAAKDFEPGFDIGAGIAHQGAARLDQGLGAGCALFGPFVQCRHQLLVELFGTELFEHPANEIGHLGGKADLVDISAGTGLSHGHRHAGRIA